MKTAKKARREDDYGELFLKKFLASEDLKKQQEVLGSFFKRPIWWIIGPAFKKTPNFKDTPISGCGLLKKSSKRKGRCYRGLVSAIKRAKKTRAMTRFICANNLSGFCLPIARGSKIYGYIGLCHMDSALPARPAELFANFIDTLISNIQKELELSTLYETIRPRAIALSTVHTIHRLISSTLDMDELLPRIARLSMQVVQANRCSVKLMDKERNILVPVTTIDLRSKRKLYPKELKLGKGVPGKAAKFAKVLRSRDFLSIPLIDEEVIGVITIYDKINKKPFTQFDQEIMMTISEQAVIAIKNAQMYKEQENLAISGIKSLAAVLDTRAASTFIPRTAFVNIVLAIGTEMGLDQADLHSLHCAALLHDAGQILVPDEILSKPSRLTGEEYSVIKEHPARGAKMLEPTKYLKPVIPIILHHHENYDGSGYPNRLKGNQIPLGARIMAVVSAFLAMITPRSYRVTKTIQEAIDEIARNSGTQFDPKVVAAFLKIIQKKQIQDVIEKEYNHGPQKASEDTNIF